MSLDPRNLNLEGHPLAGKISTGIRTTENKARAPKSNVSMPITGMPTVTMEDRAGQMFGMKDVKGTRVYYAINGVFNTVDEKGIPITFIQGLFKTTDKDVCDFLQQFVNSRAIHYLELKENPTDGNPQRTEGGSSSPESSYESDQQESPHRKKLTSDPDRSGTGGEGTSDAEQPQHRTTISSSGGAGDDSSSQEVEEKTKPPSLKDRLNR